MSDLFTNDDTSRPASRSARKLLQLSDFLSPEAWRAAFMEFLATAAFVFSSICIIISCSQLNSSNPVPSIALLHFLVISFLILAVGASSGGHLNPCISFIAMVLGHISPSLTFMYTLAQCLGGLIGTVLVKSMLSDDLADKFSVGGCMVQNAQGAGLTTGSAFIGETFFTFFLMFVVATLAFDPYRAPLTGPLLAPALIAASVGLLIFMSAGVATGYSGAAMNPARCLGPAIVMGRHLWTGHWIFWLAPYLATLLVAVFYCLVPPHHGEIYRSKKDMVTKIKTALSKHNG